MAYGFVYVMRNQCMPGIYKIGYTDRPPMTRCDELSSSTSVPMAFEIVCYGEVEDARKFEFNLHEDYKRFRISTNREFFKIPIYGLRELMGDIRSCCSIFAYGDTSFVYEGIEDFQVKEKRDHFFGQEADPIHWPVFDDEAPF